MHPSDVAAEISTNPPSTCEEAEGLLQRVLSLLATLEPPEFIIPSSQIWAGLNNEVTWTAVEATANKEEWMIGIRIMGKVLHESDALLSPFEIHNIAMQASVFCETQQVELYSTTCILLCGFALWKCPPRVTSRPKRWRSSLFETVRLCQRHLDFLSIETLVNNVIPACVHVRNALPEGTDTPHWLAGFQSAIVQMTSYLALKLVMGKDINGRPDSMQQLCHGVEHALGGNFEVVLHARYFSDTELQSTSPRSHAKWIKLWMSGMAGEEDYEALASVETEVDPGGLAELSCFWFDWSGRPQIFSGSHLWHLLFPSVSILLNADDCIDSQLHGFVLLQRLLSLIQNTSLPPASTRRPDHPKGTFQLLANRIVADATKEKSASQTSSLPNGAKSFQLMKSLLAKYHFREQVRLVENLHEQCPHPGLRPKIIDLLRDIVNWNDAKALTRAWSFLDSRVQALEKEYIRSSNGSHQVVDAEDLVMEAEDFAAAIGVLRLWYMIRRTQTGVPDAEGRMQVIQEAISQAMSTKHGSLDIFRLGILEGSIQMLLDLPGRGEMEE